jgi:hypothetical protein
VLEVGVVDEGRRREPGRADPAVRQVEDDQGGTGEVDVDVGPERLLRREFQVFRDEPLRREPHLAFLHQFLVSLVCVRLGVAAGWCAGHGVGHPQVRAPQVDDGLALRRVVLGEAFECVQPGEAHRRLARPELVGGLGVQVGDPP